MADEIRRLIRVRTDKGARFKRDGFGKKRQLADSWRKPRGQHNKQREQRKAKGALPKPGFGSPVAVRGMHPSGFFEVLVHTTEDLEGLNPKTQSIRIAAKVGNRKRALIQEKALAAGLRVLNARAEKPEKKVPEAPAALKEEKAGKQKPKKEKKTPSGKKGREKPVIKEEKPAGKKPAVAEEKSPAKKKTQEKAQPESEEKPQKKEGQKKKAQTTAADTGAVQKQKKASRVKAESSGEEKPAKKTTAKPKKKTMKEGDEQ